MKSEVVYYAMVDLRKYARQGDELIMVNTDHLPVAIVSKQHSTPFPCRIEQLSISPVNALEVTVIPRKVAESKKPLTQAEKLQLEYLKSK